MRDLLPTCNVPVLALLTGLALCGVGCGGDDPVMPDAAAVDAAPDAAMTVDPALDATWRYLQCTAQRLHIDKTFAGNDVQTRNRFYRQADTGCAQPYSISNLNATYTLRGPAPFAAGAIKIDYVTTAATLVAADSTAVDYRNSISYCGYSNWQLNVAKDVTGKTCTDGTTVDTFPAAGEVHYDIYRVNGVLFYLGDSTTGTGTSEATRPTQLSGVTLQR